MIGGSRNIVEGAGPSATLVAHASVLDVPYRKAAVGEGFGLRAAVIDRVARKPNATVDIDDQRVRTGDVR